MDVNTFLNELENIGIDFYTGVPDSRLKALCDTLYSKFGIGNRHIVAANEGGAVGLAAGHYIATGKPALVYMQNSGIGNAVNPIVSLLNEQVYDIPCVFVIGWRGEPDSKDEPQHKFQGEITIKLLELMRIKYFIISKETTNNIFVEYVKSCKQILNCCKSVAFVIRGGGLTTTLEQPYKNSFLMTRENALKIIVNNIPNSDIIVSTTGKTSRELFEIREDLNQNHTKDFLTVGSMGHSSMIAMGIALEQSNRNVWCLDGDGAAIMHLGNMILAGETKCNNLIYVVFNNGSHESVGGMPVVYGNLDFYKIACSSGYNLCFKVDNEKSLLECIHTITDQKGIKFIEIMIAIYSRKNLGRPTINPCENKKSLIRFLNE